MRFYSFLVLFGALLIAKGQTRIVTGVGVGNILQEEHNVGKGIVFLSGYLRLQDQFEIGAEIASGGNIFPSDGSTFEQNTEILSSASFRFTTALLKGRYLFSSGTKSPYIEGGAGFTTNKFFVHAVDQKSVTKTNFTGSIELGYQLNEYGLGLRFIPIGETPSFSGIDENGGNISLASDRFSMILLTFSYSFHLN